MMSTSRQQRIPPHSFRIPVMGLGYTIVTPVMVAHRGISSVVSIIEDGLLERMREFHCRRNGEPFVPIPKPSHDHGVRRITAYLDLLHCLVDQNMARVRSAPFSPGSESTTCFDMLDDGSALKKQYLMMLALPEGEERTTMQDELRRAMVPGAIDANIMSKIDTAHFDKEGNALPPDCCDAMAALRGLANSTLSSSVVLSAGYNPRPYVYITGFPDFLPDAEGHLRKRIILKVSDPRSALIQGKILAKKGVWVSEFRIESGLNCEGQAFATDGILLGPVMEEFRNRRQAIAAELLDTRDSAWAGSEWPAFPARPAQRITVQGGIGTAAEDRFLREFYGMEGTGWGSPILLGPEATNVDKRTLEQLTHARPTDFYLSWAAPLGIPFHNCRPSTSEQQRLARIAKGRPGSPCYKNYLSAHSEFAERPHRNASRQNQDPRIQPIKAQGLDDASYARQVAALEDKVRLCEGLGASAMLKEGMHLAHKLEVAAICPGPNTACFSSVVSLRNMMDRIHGRTDPLDGVERPHMSMKELSLYVEFLRRELQQVRDAVRAEQQRYFATFRADLEEGMRYYEQLIPTLRSRAGTNVQRMRIDLEHAAQELCAMLLPVAAPVG